MGSDSLSRLVGRVEVRRVRRELGGAGVDARVDRRARLGRARSSRTLVLRRARAARAICASREAERAWLAQQRSASSSGARAERAAPRRTMRSSCAQEPGVDRGQRVQTSSSVTPDAQRVARRRTGGRASGIAITRSSSAPRARRRSRRRQRRRAAAALGGASSPRSRCSAASSREQRGSRRGRAARSEPSRAGLERARRLLQRLAEGAADRHHLADALHLRAERAGRRPGTSRTRSAAILTTT